MTFLASLFKRHILLVLFLVFLLSLILLTYKDYGIPWDEKVFFSTGKYFAVETLHYFRIPTNLSVGNFKPTIYHLKGHGVFMEMLVVVAGMFFPRFNFETLHLIRAVFAVPIFVLVYWIVSRFISKVYGLIAVIFLLLSPRFYPEIFYNAVDISTALLFTVCLSYFSYYIQSKQTILKSVIFGLLLGVTISQRLLLFYLPVVNLIFLFFQPKKNLKQLAIQQLVIFLFLLLSLHLTHPFLLAHPVTGLIDILQSAKQYPWNAAVLFDGQFYQAGVNPIPWYYLIKTMLITTPPVLILLFIIGEISFIAVLFGKKDKYFKLTGIYLLTLFNLPVFLNFIFKPTLYDSWRHFLFLTVPGVIIAAEGLHRLLANKSLRLANYKNIPAYLTNTGNWDFHLIGKGIIGLVVLGSLFTTAIQMIGLHPYEYVYYNSLIGGLKGAYGKYETDYWGLGYKDAVLWFNKNINDPKKQYKIVTEGDPLSSTYYFKSNMLLTSNRTTADYLFTFTRWNFHIRHPGKTIYTVQRDGVPLLFIKKL